MKPYTLYKLDNMNVTLIGDISDSAREIFDEQHQDVLLDEMDILFNKDPRAQFNQIDTESFSMVIRTVVFELDEGVGEFSSIKVVSHKNNIYISCEHEIAVLKTICHKDNEDLLETSFDFLIKLLDLIMIEMESHIYAIEDQVDEMESKLLDSIDAENRIKVLSCRRKIIELRRHLLPQKEAMNTMTHAIKSLDAERENEIYDLYQRNLRVCDYLEAMRERLSLMQEEMSAAINDRMNQNMYRLSIIATIFLPLGFITGLLGINVGGMPGVQSHDAFWLVAFGSAVIGLLIWIYFKYKKWFF